MTAAACQKASRQLEQQLQRIFADRHKTGQLDLEAAETAIRSTVHQTGADTVTELLRFPPPDGDHRSIPCACGRVARYEGMRSRPILTVVGWASIHRAYYLCSACHTGQFPADVELDIDKTDFSPGVRRMLAAVGGMAPFTQGRDQLKLLAGLEVTAKTVERTAESIGEAIEIRKQKDIQGAQQLRLPVVAGPSIPYLYFQMDGTQVFVVKAETEARAGRTPGQPARTRECKLGAVFTQTTVDDQGRPMRAPPPMSARLNRLKSLVCEFIWRPGTGGGSAPLSVWSWVMAHTGSGTSPIGTFPVLFKSLISITPASIFGTWLASCIPPGEV